MGGVHPSENKLSCAKPIEVLPLPDVVTIPLAQHIGAPAVAKVAKGDRVLTGQLIAEAGSFMSANIHSPISGTVTAVDMVVNGQGLRQMMITIKREGDDWAEGIDRSEALVKVCSFSAQEIIAKIKDAGIVGMGGAAFPTNVKLDTSKLEEKPDTLIVNGSRQLMKKKGFSAEANMGFNILIAVIGSLVLMGGLVWTGFRIAKAPSLQGHINAETRTSPAYPAGDTEHTYTVYHDPLPLTVEDLVGETVYKDYSCYREIQGSPLLTEYTYKQEVPFVFSISEQDGPELLYEIYEVKLNCLYEPVKQSFFTDTVYNIPGRFKFAVSQSWTPVDAAPWGALDAYRFIREDNTPIGNFLLCYADRFVEIRFDPWYDGAAPTEKQMALVGTVLGNGPLS